MPSRIRGSGNVTDVSMGVNGRRPHSHGVLRSLFRVVTTTSVLHSLPGLSTKILDVRGFDSSKILRLRGGLLMSTGTSPEMLSRRILAGIILAGRWGAVLPADVRRCYAASAQARERASARARENNVYIYIYIYTHTHAHMYMYIYIYT